MLLLHVRPEIQVTVDDDDLTVDVTLRDRVVLRVTEDEAPDLAAALNAAGAELQRRRLKSAA